MRQRHLLVRHWMRLIVVFSAALFIGVQLAHAEDHDLAVTGVWADPEALTCGSKVCARIYVAGEKDHRLGSGQVVVRFSAQIEGGAWAVIGEAPIEWGPSEQGLEKGAVKVVCLNFSPASTSNHQFRAEAVYPSGIEDGYPADNIKDSSWYTVASVCSKGRLCPAFYVPGTGWVTECGKDDDSHILPPAGKCKLLPFACVRPPDCARYPILCERPSFSLCEFAPAACHALGPVNVYFDDRGARRNFGVINAEGTLIARAEPLSKPISEGGTTYTLGLRYTASPEETYYLVIWPSGETKLGAKLPFSVLVKQARSEK